MLLPLAILPFPAAMALGDELSIYCEIVREGNTSITIAAEGISRERKRRDGRSWCGKGHLRIRSCRR